MALSEELKNALSPKPFWQINAKNTIPHSFLNITKKKSLSLFFFFNLSNFFGGFCMLVLVQLPTAVFKSSHLREKLLAGSQSGL